MGNVGPLFPTAHCCGDVDNEVHLKEIEVAGSNPAWPTYRPVAQLAERVNLHVDFSRNPIYMKKGTEIKIEKLRASDSPIAPTPDKVDYVPGQLNKDVSLPSEYWAIGVLTHDIEVGKPLIMTRSNRNGVVAPGFFNTSEVKKLEGNIMHTANSVYKVTTTAQQN